MTPMTMQDELNFVIGFAAGDASEGNFVYKLNREQLRALWTAFCLHNKCNPDTLAYDIAIAAIWNKVLQQKPRPACWSSFKKFDLYMGSLLS